MNDRGSPDMPELNLWRACLLKALDDLNREESQRQSALRWFKSSCTSIGSSKWLAEVLGLDHSCLVKAVTRPRVKPVRSQLTLPF